MDKTIQHYGRTIWRSTLRRHNRVLQTLRGGDDAEGKLIVGTLKARRRGERDGSSERSKFNNRRTIGGELAPGAS